MGVSSRIRSIELADRLFHCRPMSDFIESLGRPFIATALKRVSDQFQAGAANWYRGFGLSAPVRTASAVLLLAQERRPLGITELASRLRQSHPTIIDWIRELEAIQLVQLVRSAADKRLNLVSLTDKGTEEAARIRAAQSVFEKAFLDLSDEVGGDIFPLLIRLERACLAKPMASRLRDAQEAIATRADA